MSRRRAIVPGRFTATASIFQLIMKQNWSPFHWECTLILIFMPGSKSLGPDETNSDVTRNAHADQRVFGLYPIVNIFQLRMNE